MPDLSSITSCLDRYQQRRPWLSFSFAVYQRYSDDQGAALAALLAYYAFFSIFPLLLVLVTVLAYVVPNDPDLRTRICDDVLGSIPLGCESDPVQPLRGNAFALVSGVALALWNGLGLARQAQAAFNTVYSVPRHEWPRFLPQTGRSILGVLIGGSGFTATTLIVATVSGAAMHPLAAVLGALLALILNAGLFAVLFRILTAAEIGWGEVVPGAFLTATGWLLVQMGGTALFTHEVTRAQATYGTFATVIGLLTIFALLAQITLIGAEVNVVRCTRLWPRGLGSLTGEPTVEADYRSYTSYAARQRHAALARKQVDVEFHGPGTPPPAELDDSD